MVMAKDYGLKVTGIDVSFGLIESARRRAAESNLTVEYRVMHARDLGASGEFNHAAVIFNTFSLFSPEDAPVVLRNIGRALKGDGNLFMDLDNKPFNCRYGKSETRRLQSPEGPYIQQVYFHDRDSVETFRDVFFDGEGEVTGEFVGFKRIYSQDEIRDLLALNGFRTDRVFGDWDLSRLTDDSPKIIVVASKAPMSGDAAEVRQTP